MCDIMCPLSGHVEGVSEVKVRLPLPTSIVITPVVDKLQECGKNSALLKGCSSYGPGFNKQR